MVAAKSVCANPTLLRVFLRVLPRATEHEGKKVSLKRKRFERGKDFKKGKKSFFFKETKVQKQVKKVFFKKKS